MPSFTGYKGGTYTPTSATVAKYPTLAGQSFQGETATIKAGQDALKKKSLSNTKGLTGASSARSTKSTVSNSPTTTQGRAPITATYDLLNSILTPSSEGTLSTTRALSTKGVGVTSSFLVNPDYLSSVIARPKQPSAILKNPSSSRSIKPPVTVAGLSESSYKSGESIGNVADIFSNFLRGIVGIKPIVNDTGSTYTPTTGSGGSVDNTQSTTDKVKQGLTYALVALGVLLGAQLVAGTIKSIKNI